MRVGKIAPEPIQLFPGDHFTFTTEDIVGDRTGVSVSFARLPKVVKPGDRLFLNDGQVEVVGRRSGQRRPVQGHRRRRIAFQEGLNLSGIDLGISAFTDHDRACLEFALENGVDAVSQSFVEKPADIEAVRAAANAIGQEPFIIAKIERADALTQFDEILRRPTASWWCAAILVWRCRSNESRLSKRNLSPTPIARQTGHHRHANARVDDHSPPADARRVHGCGQRHS